MDEKRVAEAFSALGQDVRLKVLRLLIVAGPQGLPAGEIADRLGVRQNTMSANLAVLLAAGLVRNERHGRVIRYFADLGGIGAVIGFLLEDCCGGHPEFCRPVLASALACARDGAGEGGGKSCTNNGWGTPMAERSEHRPYNVLFLCTGNSARSIIAEAILQRAGVGRFVSFSAGSMPKGEVHPIAIETLKRANHDVSAMRSKSWNEFAEAGAPVMDFVFTVCDNAADEVCPLWPGQPMTAHWGVPDPAAVEGTEAEKAQAFSDTYRMLNNRISVFVNLPYDGLDRVALQKRLDEIGRGSA